MSPLRKTLLGVGVALAGYKASEGVLFENKRSVFDDLITEAIDRVDKISSTLGSIFIVISIVVPLAALVVGIATAARGLFEMIFPQTSDN